MSRSIACFHNYIKNIVLRCSNPAANFQCLQFLFKGYLSINSKNFYRSI